MSISPRESARAIVQDMPPPGGFAKIDFTRSLPARGPKGWQLWAAATTAVVYGFYQVGQCNKARNQQLALERKARYHLAPIMQAEADREYMQRELICLKKEAEVMQNVSGWEVGYNTYRSGKFMPRAINFTNIDS
mmetsp:Transcript_44598/g.53984  ORF Transcript_44598/g.53984 Transcript_44598/m.53984 type:complete len:135 (+) Transcript_44598:112-516(+)|eukprot:CAMPEP_0172517164 /NCGR_PEP_ID=MMETSP1066-20121228/282544_1 /TAXON_ID=671091 /ORGANISM="Coscinodiscus wailesii, Strain CCMP2513" /LENGTH=134 /DNA_ID=CAMNT_0013299017 /DNA_START=110 /DNA_END=514 /DNA_ORIENTATION=-